MNTNFSAYNVPPGKELCVCPLQNQPHIVSNSTWHRHYKLASPDEKDRMERTRDLRGFNLLSRPPDEAAGSASQKRHRDLSSGSNQTRKRSRLTQPPPDDRRHDETPSDEEGYPLEEDSADENERDRSPPTDRERDKSPPNDRERDQSPPNDRERDQSPPNDRERDQSPPNDAQRDQTPPREQGYDNHQVYALNFPYRRRPNINIDHLVSLATLPDMRTAMQYVCLMRQASLSDEVSKLSEGAIERMRNPPTHAIHIDHGAARYCISVYLSLEHTSQQAYERVCNAAALNLIDANMAKNLLTYGRTERLIAQYTGVESIEHDMCFKSCVAFTGPYADLDTCPYCDTSRWDQVRLQASQGRTKVGVRQAITIPVGPQLQARYRNPDSACEMKYLHQRTEQILEEFRASGRIPVIEDIAMGHDYLSAYLAGDVKPNDIVLSISLDGAQLYEKKQSDCWIYVWIIINLAPDKRYRKINEHCKALEHELSMAVVQRDTLQTLFTQLVEALKMSGSNIDVTTLHCAPQPPREAASPQTHTAIRFWDKSHYIEWKKNAVSNVKGRGQLPYLETDNGGWLDAETVQAVRRLLAGGWRDLKRKNEAPRTWRQASPAAAASIRRLMETMYPLFTFANNGWKLQHLCTTHYPSWARRHVHTKSDKAGQEPTVDAADDFADVDDDDEESQQEEVKIVKKRKLGVSSPTVVAQQLKRARKGKSKASESASRVAANVLSTSTDYYKSPSPPPSPSYSLEPSVELQEPPPIRMQSRPVTPAPLMLDEWDPQSPLPLHTRQLEGASHPPPTPEAVLKHWDSPQANNARLEPPSTLRANKENIPPTTSLDTAQATTSGPPEPPLTPRVNKESTPPTTSLDMAQVTNSGPSEPLSTSHAYIAPRAIDILSVEALKVAGLVIPPLPPMPDKSAIKPPAKTKPKKTPCRGGKPGRANPDAKTKFRPGTSANGRNLCGHRWVKQVKRGFTREFTEYYDALTEPQREAYEREASEMDTSGKWIAKTLGDGTMY